MPIAKSMISVAGPVALPARALMLAREGQKALAVVRDLPPDERAALERNAEELGLAVARVTRAARAEVVRSHRPAALDWERAKAQALHPGPEFALAKLLVEAVKDAKSGRSMSTSDLAAAVGAIGTRDGIFRTALHIAEEDGYLERTVNRHWRLTAFADLAVSDASHIKALEESIIAHIEAVGLTSTEALAHAVDCDDPAAPEFLAALHRAVTEGRVSWLNWCTYGLPPARLACFDDVDPPESDAERAAPDLRQEAQKVASAVRAIRHTLQSSSHSNPSSVLRADTASDPASRLKRLTELHAAGLVDDDEFLAKKRELIQLL